MEKEMATEMTMKGVSVYLRKDVGPGRPWQVIIKNKNQDVASDRFPTKEKGWAWAREYQAANAEDMFGEAAVALLPDSGELLDEKVSKTIELFSGSSECTKRHRDHLKPILARVGVMKLRDVKTRWVKAYVEAMRKQRSKLGRPYADASIKSQLSALSMACKWRAEKVEQVGPHVSFSCVDWQSNDRERRFDEEGVEERLITYHFRKRKAKKNNYHFRLLIKLAIETGARQQELLKACRGEFKMGPNPFWIIPGAHTKCKVTRTVPLTFKAIRVVKVLIKLMKPGEPRMFHTFGGRCVSTTFRMEMERLGIQDLKWHDLRHEAISRFTETQPNFSVEDIMQMVGHSSIKMHRRYKHLRGGMLAQKIKKV